MFRVLASVVFLLLCQKAFAYEVAECTILNVPYYKNVVFKMDYFASVDLAGSFAKQHDGQVYPGEDEHGANVIWNETIPAPAMQYQCVHVESDD